MDPGGSTGVPGLFKLFSAPFRIFMSSFSLSFASHDVEVELRERFHRPVRKMAAPSAKHLSYGSARIPGFPAMQKTSAEVIVVGGGLGGLQAAYEAQQAGMTCLVLEQDDVLGGYWNWNAHYAGVDDGHHPKTTGVLRELGLLPDLLDATDVQNQETACTGDLSSVSWLFAIEGLPD